MTSDTMRYVKQMLGDAAHSDYGKSLGQEAFRELVRRVIPHLYDWVNDRFHEVWSWFRQNF
jgi:hypothetical protein